MIFIHRSSFPDGQWAIIEVFPRYSLRRSLSTSDSKERKIRELGRKFEDLQLALQFFCYISHYIHYYIIYIILHYIMYIIYIYIILYTLYTVINQNLAVLM